MDTFCDSPLWQHNLTWNVTSYPDFTPCFQETVLTWIPCLIILLFGPLEVVSSIRRDRNYIPVTLLNLFKAFLSTVLCILSVVELVDVIYKQDSSAPVYYVTPIVRSITYVLVFALNMIHRNRGIHTSGLMLLFWFLMSVVSIINIRSLFRTSYQDDSTGYAPEWHLSELQFTLRLVACPCIVVQLVLACIADKKSQDPFIVTGDDLRHQSPESSASVLSLITFWWLNGLIWLGYKRSLTQDDLYALKPHLKTEFVIHKFEKILQHAIREALVNNRAPSYSKKNDEPASRSLTGRNNPSRSSWIPLVRNRRDTRRSHYGNDESHPESAKKEEIVAKYVGITKIMLRSFWSSILLASSLKLIISALTFASPLLLNRIITFVKSPDEPAWRGSVYAGSLFLLSILESGLSASEFYLTNVNVMKIRTCVTSALYKKTLRLSHKGKKQFTSGEIVNLMSIDAQRVADFVQNLNSLWSAPITLTVSLILLYQQLGLAVLAGLGIMLVNIPFNAWVAIKLRELQQSVMKFKDKRIKLLSEIFNGIKVIKIHAWESSFQSRVEAFRGKEIDNLSKQTWYSAAITFAFTCLPFVVSLASFGTYILMDPNNVLDANRIFVSLALFNIMRVPLAVLPMLITNLLAYTVAVKRLNRFFEADETNPDSIGQIEDDGHVIRVENGTFKWSYDSEPVLEAINLSVPRRKLIAVVGPVGSGKSSLLSAILGELEKTTGKVLVDQKSSIAYVPQEPWILNSTLKNNIIFTKLTHQERYQKVLEACALIPDLKTLEYGDQSEIGEKGINLSGGQKQRISLARAVYADTDIYLMDDPLNAVDAHVGKHIFDNIIGPKGLLCCRTRVLVTNKLSILPEVDYIIVMKDGKISESGTYHELLEDRGLFSQLLVKYLLENDQGSNITEAFKPDIISQELKRLEEKWANETRNSSDRCLKMAADNKFPAPTADTTQDKTLTQTKSSKQNDGGARNLTGEEVAQVGSVGLEVHKKFIRTMGMNFAIALAIYIMSSAFTLSSNLWLSEWSSDSDDPILTNSTSQRNLRLGVYAGLGFGESICVIVSTILLNLACLRGSKLLHNKMLARILQAPINWFNSTPSGRILNRFSKDIDAVDVTIRFNVRLLMVVALRSVTSLILISVGSVFSIAAIVPVVLLYFVFQIFYVSSSRQLKRIESTTKSPIYTHFGETIAGTTSIRAFGAAQEFILQSNQYVDVNNASFYIGFVASRWLSLRLEFLGFLVVLTTSMMAVLLRGTISPGIAGLTVTYSLTVTQVLSFLVRIYSDYETNVVSVERLLEYTSSTPIEPDDDEEPSDPNWPSKGNINFDNFSTRYRPDLELVLNKLDLKIYPATRVGLVGRTGAGKSSITLALFRILEAAEGRIVIDDVDISHINLKVLRSRLSIIPQEPILFTGTIRQNIDPTEQYSDEEVWKVVDLAHLGQFLRALPEGLSYEVSEGGGNFSVGQKQLFCLARTLLRRSKILILDEATAAVDVETDNLIQATIRKEFQSSTILTVAHRLETIQDYDKIVTIEAGSAVEEGPPSALIKDPSSKFYGMAKELPNECNIMIYIKLVKHPLIYGFAFIWGIAQIFSPQPWWPNLHSFSGLSLFIKRLIWFTSYTLIVSIYIVYYLEVLVASVKGYKEFLKSYGINETDTLSFKFVYYTYFIWKISILIILVYTTTDFGWLDKAWQAHNKYSIFSVDFEVQLRFACVAFFIGILDSCIEHLQIVSYMKYVAPDEYAILRLLHSIYTPDAGIIWQFRIFIYLFSGMSAGFNLMAQCIKYRPLVYCLYTAQCIAFHLTNINSQLDELEVHESNTSEQKLDIWISDNYTPPEQRSVQVSKYSSLYARLAGFNNKIHSVHEFVNSVAARGGGRRGSVVVVDLLPKPAATNEPVPKAGTSSDTKSTSLKSLNSSAPLTSSSFSIPLSSLMDKASVDTDGSPRVISSESRSEPEGEQQHHYLDLETISSLRQLELHLNLLNLFIYDVDTSVSLVLFASCMLCLIQFISSAFLVVEVWRSGSIRFLGGAFLAIAPLSAPFLLFHSGNRMEFESRRLSWHLDRIYLQDPTRCLIYKHFHTTMDSLNRVTELLKGVRFNCANLMQINLETMKVFILYTITLVFFVIQYDSLNILYDKSAAPASRPAGATFSGQPRP